MRSFWDLIETWEAWRKWFGEEKDRTRIHFAYGFFPQIHFPFEKKNDANSIASNGMETDKANTKHSFHRAPFSILHYPLNGGHFMCGTWSNCPIASFLKKSFTFDQTHIGNVFHTFLCPFMCICLPINVNYHFQILRNKENIHSTTISISSLLYMIFLKMWPLETWVQQQVICQNGEEGGYGNLYLQVSSVVWKCYCGVKNVPSRLFL